MNIAIIGGGLSGTLLAHYLLQEDRYPVSIYLFEKEYHQLSRGIAYRASEEKQLLNVPAGSMSLHNMAPDDFYHWLIKNEDGTISPEAFVARALFGTYLKELLQKSIDKAKNVTVKVITDEVTDILKEDGLHILTASNHFYQVDRAVVANGILPSQDPFILTTDVKLSGRYQSNPWNFRYWDRLAEKDHVVLIGTGLTMLDHAAGLLKDDRNFRVSAFSRRGLLPLLHAQYRAYDFPDYSVIPTNDIGVLLKSIRKYYKVHQPKGLDWRNLIDKVREQVPKLWAALSVESKARFIRHLKPYWEIHRHRAPQQVLEVILKAIQEKRFIALKGSLQTVKSLGNVLELTISGGNNTHTLHANYVLNSSGLQQNISLTSDLLLKNLLHRGHMIPDVNSLGVETDEVGALQCRTGEKNIFTLGALRRAAVFECTAAKEISEHAFQLSQTLLSQRLN